MTQDKKCILVFELGHLLVFYYQTMEEYSQKIQPSEIFWQKKGESTVHGPFPTAWHAVDDYSNSLTPLPDNVISVDFKAKKRIT